MLASVLRDSVIRGEKDFIPSYGYVYIYILPPVVDEETETREVE